MSELSEHVKRTVVNLSIPENEEGRVKYEYFTVEEWDSIEAEKEAQRLPLARERRVVGIKQEAKERIEAVLPEYKQRNALARAIDLLDLKSSGEATISELQELVTLREIWGQIKDIRDASDDTEVVVSTSETPDEVVW